MAECVNCIHHDVCVKLGKPSLYGINKELGCDKYLEVVRCKGCEHWKDGVAGCTDHVKLCEIGYYMVGENGYCVYGERR